MTRILVVDDELAVRNLVSDMIAPGGYEIVKAENVAQAFDICKEVAVDLIITDIVMPEKNGIDLILRVKKEYPDIPVIAISGGGGITGQFDYLEIADLVGAKNILKKPFDIAELRSAVETVLKNKAAA